MNKIYIHYGNTGFDKTKGFPIKNRDYAFPKPNGGLWASPANTSWGWKEWCKTEEFGECDKANSFQFKVNNNANIFTIKSVKDLNMLPRRKNELTSAYYAIDFEKCASQGIDAIELDWYEHNRDKIYSIDEDLYFQLYGWDCDSIVILNPDIVEVI